jgi:hypothetical protein
MPKISQLPQDSAPTTDDYLVAVDSTSGQTKKVLVSDVETLAFNQASIPSISGSPILRHTDMMFDFIASGCVWSGDSYGSTRAASMTSGVVYINGKRLTVAAVSARTFTASKDVYVGFNDNGDGTAAIVYYDNTTNAASPSLATGGYTVLNAIIVVGASSIASVASVNQGQESKALPIASSIQYTVCDSLGNLICPRDPNRQILGMRLQTGGAFSTASTSAVAITGTSCPVIVPTGRKIRVSVMGTQFYNSGGAQTSLQIYEGASSGTLTTSITNVTAGANTAGGTYPAVTFGVRTTSLNNPVYITASLNTAATGTSTVSSLLLIVELV